MNEAGPPLHLRLQAYLTDLSHRDHLPNPRQTDQCALRLTRKTFLSFWMYSVTLVFRLPIDIAGTNPSSAISGIPEGRQPCGFPPASLGRLGNLVFHCMGPFMQTPDDAWPGKGLQTFQAARSFERATSPGTFSATSRSPRSDGSHRFTAYIHRVGSVGALVAIRRQIGDEKIY
jgi:hypothetical protein